MELRQFKSLEEMDSRHIYVQELDPALNRELVDAAHAERRADPQGVSYSNDGGWQSRAIAFLQDNDGSVLPAGLRKIFNVFGPDTTVTYWYSINSHGSTNKIHTHSYLIYNRSLGAKLRLAFCRLFGITMRDPFWSGVYYVQAPEGAGDINFYRPNLLGSVLNQFAATRGLSRQVWKPALSVRPEAGKLYVFHCTRYHSVSPTPGGNERISLAMDIS